VTREELDWKQYDMMALTIRWGIELLLKANVFYYAVTGAILSFYLSRPAPQPSTLKFALVVPALLALVLAVIFLIAGPICVIVCTAAGLFDLWVDFRRQRHHPMLP